MNFQSEERKTVTIKADNEVSAREEAKGVLGVKEVHITTISFVPGETGVRYFTYADRLFQ